MKKIFVFMLVALVTTVVKAQDWDFGSDDYETKRHNFGIELGVGGYGDLATNLGFRWQMNFHPNIAWDVLTVKAITTPDGDVLDNMLLEGMTGLRFISPEFAGLTAYVVGKGGYGHYIDIDNGGVCYEFGAGINVTRHLYIGYAFNGLSYKEDINVGTGRKPKWEERTCKMKYHSFQIGWTF